jgi:hypothetical protein
VARVCLLPCAGSAVAAVTGVSHTGSTVLATHEVGEVSPGTGSAHSMWYLWVPAVTKAYTVSTSGSSFDTLLAVYAATATVPTAQPVGACVCGRVASKACGAAWV